MINKNNIKYRIVLMSLSVSMLMACDTSNVDDCLRTTGALVEKTMVLSEFSRIYVNREIELFIEQGEDYSVRVLAGENLIDDVKVDLNDDQLIITDNNTCNWFREYGTTKVYVSAPDLKEIRTSTQYDVSSIGLLSYENLILVSEDFTDQEAFSVGDFRLHVDIDNLTITSNNISSFYISGQTTNLQVGFFNGVGRFEGANLKAERVIINHRGSNDMIINPSEAIEGVIRGVGDVYLIQVPPVVDIEQLYTGQIIYPD